MSENLIRGLSGFVLSHNCIRLDYPIFECIESIMPICDEVVVSDAGSNDGTLSRLKTLAFENRKVRIVSHPASLFPDGQQVLNDWMAEVKKALRYDMQLMIDADEILDPGSFDPIRRAVMDGEPRIFNYVNFWLDAQHTCPWGDGRKLHLMRTDQVMHTHGQTPPGYDEIRDKAKTDPRLITYHYSALRRRQAFFAKCRIMSKRCAWEYSDRGLIAAEDNGTDFMQAYPDRLAATVPFLGQHPKVMHNWITERGWKIT